ncbi:MAG TPA: flagellar protein FlgN [Tepidisphaeraceae bacterium]|nr:flagellar protein FlgN [Tepidisphaeraceae bacterium]
MSRQITELESLLAQMIVEHKKLLASLEVQQAAMKKCDLKVMDEVSTAQEACRLRISGLEQKRRLAVAQVAREAKLIGDVTLRKLAAVYPARAEALLKLRTELKTVTEQIRTRAYISSRVANAVLGHLNTVVRLVAGAVEKAGIYNKRGIPRVSNRIGVMEAVG